MGATEEKHAVPHRRVETVATTRRETGVQALDFRNGLKLARATVVGEERHGSRTVVGFKVNHDLPAGPSAIGIVVVEINGHGIVGQHDAIDKAGTWILACGDEIDAAILSGQVGVGAGSLVAHRGQHRTVAISIVTNAEASAPPIAEQVQFNLDGAACREVKLKLRSRFVGSHLTEVGVGIVEENPHGLIGSGLASTAKVFSLQLTATGTVGTCHPAVLAVQRSVFREIVEVV